MDGQAAEGSIEKLIKNPAGFVLTGPARWPFFAPRNPTKFYYGPYLQYQRNPRPLRRQNPSFRFGQEKGRYRSSRHQSGEAHRFSKSSNQAHLGSGTRHLRPSQAQLPRTQDHQQEWCFCDAQEGWPSLRGFQFFRRLGFRTRARWQHRAFFVYRLRPRRAVPSRLVLTFSSLSPAAPAVPPYLVAYEKVGFHRWGNRRKEGERSRPRRAVPSQLVSPSSPLSPAAPAVPPYLVAYEKVGFHRWGNRRKGGERSRPRRAVPSRFVPTSSPLSPAAPAVPPYLARRMRANPRNPAQSANDDGSGMGVTLSV
jgi:hypothetical protein